MCGDVKKERKNPDLSVLDRLNEMFPPRRMTYWPYLIAEYEVSG
jgi:hypothetical protein